MFRTVGRLLNGDTRKIQLFLLTFRISSQKSVCKTLYVNTKAFTDDTVFKSPKNHRNFVIQEKKVLKGFWKVLERFWKGLERFQRGFEKVLKRFGKVLERF